MLSFHPIFLSLSEFTINRAINEGNAGAHNPATQGVSVYTTHLSIFLKIDLERADVLVEAEGFYGEQDVLPVDRLPPFIHTSLARSACKQL